jgi:hypothetical protein
MSAKEAAIGCVLYAAGFISYARPTASSEQ